MINNLYEIIEIPFDIEEEDVWEVMGTKGRVVSELQNELTQAINEVRELSAPRAIYNNIPVEKITSKEVHISSSTVIQNKFAAHLFQGAREAILLVATIGPRIDRRISQLAKEGNNIEAIIMDAVGTVVSFNTFTYVLDLLQSDTISRGWKMGTCLNPGQTYWDITGQSIIFDLLPVKRIGVKLLETSFMKPQKSQSGIIPIGNALIITRDPSESSCKYCQAIRCPLRIEPFNGFNNNEIIAERMH
jgi:hypothetical protein